MLSNWEPMLSHQLPSLPSLETFWDALPEFFKWLEGGVTIEKPSLQAVSQEGQLYRPSYGHLGLKTLSGSSLEIIRFAASNRLCIDLDYTDNNGRRSKRLIEPYSLRHTQNGNILLYAVRAEDGQIRAYKINQINDANITNKVFVPRYQVELSPSGNFVPTTQTAPPSTNFSLPGRLIGKSSKKRVSRPKASSTYSSKPIYIYRCPICNKSFRRNTHNPKLNPHKTKDGWPCPGRTGYYENTVY